MKIYIVASLLFTVTIHNVEAQFIMPKEKDATEFKHRTLIVELREPSDKFLKKNRNDQNKIDRYKNYINSLNKITKKSLITFWNLGDKIKFLTKKEIASLLDKEDRLKYSMLRMEYGTDFRPEPSRKVIIEGFKVSAYLEGKKKAILTMMVPNDRISQFQSDMIWYNMKKYLDAAADGISMKDKKLWDFERNTKTLQNKSLVLPENAVTISESEISKFYKFPVDLVNENEYSEILTNKPNEILLVSTMFHMRKKIWMYVIVNFQTMDIVSLVPTQSGLNLSVDIGLPGLTDRGNYYDYKRVLLFRNSKGFGGGQFKAIAHKMAFKLNY